jgi:hypothetical protein
VTDNPTEGGSYIKQKDGSLKRVEFTEATAPAAPADAAKGKPPAKPAPQPIEE